MRNDGVNSDHEIHEGPHERAVLQTGYLIRGVNGRLRCRPDRGSGGYSLYESASRARVQMREGEVLIRAKLVLSFE